MTTPDEFKQQYTTTLEITGRKDNLKALKSQMDIQQIKYKVIEKARKVVNDEKLRVEGRNDLS